MAISTNFTLKELEYDGMGKAIRLRLNLEATDGTDTGDCHSVVILGMPFKKVEDWTQEEIDAEAEKWKIKSMKELAIVDLNYVKEHGRD